MSGEVYVYLMEEDGELWHSPYGDTCYWDWDSAARAAKRATRVDEIGAEEWGNVRTLDLVGKPPTDSMTIAGHLWVDVDAAKTSDKLNPVPGFIGLDVYRNAMIERNDLVIKLMDIAKDMYHDLQDTNSRFGTACLASRLRGYERRLSDAGVVDI